MKILITQRELVRLGGTEIYTVDVAKALARRGHEVAIYTKKVEGFGTRIYSSGIKAVTKLEDLDWVPDIIHAQHHMPAMVALTHFPDTPAVYFCHGVVPWAEKPPKHPRIRRYVMMCKFMVKRAIAEYHLPEDRVDYAPNFIDLSRFSEVRKVPEKPTRALLYGHGGFSSLDIQAFFRACEESNLSLDFIGYPYKNPQPRPELFLQNYDVVFAIGKCAYEAISCGCAVIPVIPNQTASLVTPENLPKFLNSNFSPLHYTSSRKLGPEWLKEELSKYNPAEVQAVTDYVRANCSINATLNKIESIYEEVLSEGPCKGGCSDAANYMDWLSKEIDELSSKIAQTTLDENRLLQTQVKELETNFAKMEKDCQLWKHSFEELQKQNGQLQHQHVGIQGQLVELQRQHRSLDKTYRKVVEKCNEISAGWNRAEAFLRGSIIGKFFWKKMERIKKSSIKPTKV